MTREKFSELNLEGLPSELVAQLSKVAVRPHAKYLEVFKEGGGILTVGEFIVGNYKMYGTILKRTSTLSALYGMRHSGLIDPTGKKGEYKLK